jgi:uncharacterized protein
MQYRKFGKFDKEVSALGFGCMRLPVNQDGSINEEEAIKQIRHAADNGVNYFDTAYVYHGGKSEVVLGKALKEGYREKVYIADKMPVWEVKTYEDFDRILDEQLNRLGVEYIDFYLLHSLSKDSWERVLELEPFKFLESAKAAGKIKHIGFSFHDGADAFMEIVDAYDWDFCQIQYNYMDEYNQATVNGLHHAASKSMAVIIMEPLLGGKLANIPPVEIQELWNIAETKRTPAEWGLSWIWNQPEVTVILSGMNSISQIDENMKVADKIHPNSLTDSEKELIDKVKSKFIELTKVNCTGCRYCEDCPQGIDIPRIFSLYNQAAMYNAVEANSKAYKHWISEEHNASVCIECGACEGICPQQLQIREHLKDAHKYLARV